MSTTVEIEAYFDTESDLWCAHGVTEDIFTQGETLDELVANIKEAVTLHMEGQLPQDETLKISIKVEVGDVPQVTAG
ncbi:MAG: type II toxin-antitoxin system HicB family antitoxin [Candidatus Bipolaricaulia bacterium]